MKNVVLAGLIIAVLSFLVTLRSVGRGSAAYALVGLAIVAILYGIALWGMVSKQA
jgi:hypothetical protein